MRNTGSSGRSKAAKDKGNPKAASQNHTNSVKSESPPVKQIMVKPGDQYLFSCTLISKAHLFTLNITD